MGPEGFARRGDMKQRIVTSLLPVVRSGFSRGGIELSILLVGVAIRLPQVYSGIGENYSFRQAQTALVAREYSEKGLLAGPTPLPVFGEGSQVPFEVPIFQLLAALIAETGISIEISGRALALFFFQVSAILGYLIVRNLSTRMSAIFFFFFSQFAGHGIIWSTAFLVEYAATAFGLAMALFFIRWFQSPSVRLLALAAIFGGLAGAVKITTLFVFLALIGFWLLFSLVGRSTVKKAVQTITIFSFVALLAVTPAVLWNRFADWVKASGEFTVFLTSDSLRSWNFGTFAQRIDPDTWLHVNPWILSIVGSPELFVLALILIMLPVWVKGERANAVPFALATLAGPLAFTNLYFVHSYYWAAVFFPALIFLGLVLGAVVDRLREKPHGIGSNVAVAGIVTLFVVGTLQNTNLGEARAVYVERPTTPISIEISELVPSGARIVMTSCDWTPLYSYESGRAVTMVPDWMVQRLAPKSNPADYVLDSFETGDYVVDCSGFAEVGVWDETSQMHRILRVGQFVGIIEQ